MLETFDPKWADIGLQLLQTVFFAVVGIIAWVNSKGKAASAEVKEVKEQVEAVDEKRRKDRADLEKRVSADKQDLINRIDSLKTDLVKRVDTVEMDVRALRENVKHLPGDTEMKELHDRITRLSENLGSKVGELTGTLKTVAATATRINEFLLNHKGKD